MTGSGGLDGYAGLRDQIERAVVSISNNIAEGFNRGTHDELLTFLYYALGSAGEVRSMFLLTGRLACGDPLRTHLDELLPLSLSVSRQLGAWIESLKNTAHRGPRYQTEATRAAHEQRRRAEAFLGTLERYKQPQSPPPDDPTDP